MMNLSACASPIATSTHFWSRKHTLNQHGDKSYILSIRMDSQCLNLNIDHVGSSGIILSVEQKAALETSLTILKSEQKFSRVYFWGKVLGIKDDYFIAQGVGKDEMAESEKKTLYR